MNAATSPGRRASRPGRPSPALPSALRIAALASLRGPAPLVVVPVSPWPVIRANSTRSHGQTSRYAGGGPSPRPPSPVAKGTSLATCAKPPVPLLWLRSPSLPTGSSSTATRRRCLRRPATGLRTRRAPQRPRAAASGLGTLARDGPTLCHGGLATGDGGQAQGVRAKPLARTPEPVAGN